MAQKKMAQKLSFPLAVFVFLLSFNSSAFAESLHVGTPRPAMYVKTFEFDQIGRIATKTWSNGIQAFYFWGNQVEDNEHFEGHSAARYLKPDDLQSLPITFRPSDVRIIRMDSRNELVSWSLFSQKGEGRKAHYDQKRPSAEYDAKERTYRQFEYDTTNGRLKSLLKIDFLHKKYWVCENLKANLFQKTEYDGIYNFRQGAVSSERRKTAIFEKEMTGGKLYQRTRQETLYDAKGSSLHLAIQTSSPL